MSTNLLYHGGHCCGIKHIYGFTQKPSDKMPKMKKWVRKFKANGDYVYDSTGINGPYFQQEAPAETALKRFQRFVDHWNKYINNGILEVVLADNDTYDNIGLQQTEHWGKHVLAAGFKLVSSCKNSNSSNRINVYHLCKDIVKKTRVSTSTPIW